MSDERIALPEATQQRLLNLYHEQQSIGAKMSEVLLVALEAIGVKGTVKNYDLSKGEAVIERLDDVPVPINRAQRRRAAKEG